MAGRDVSALLLHASGMLERMFRPEKTRSGDPLAWREVYHCVFLFVYSFLGLMECARSMKDCNQC